jgi:phosphate/sulfate permease
MTQSVDFYREQLARQRDLSAHPWGYLLPFVPGVGLSLFGRALDRSPAPNAAIAVFAVALFIGTAWWHKRSARRLQREIDELG